MCKFSWRNSAPFSLVQVMMLEIAQHVMAFLHKHDRPPVSLHQEMVKRQEEEEIKKKKKLEDEKMRFQQREMEEVSGHGLFPW